ncbi:MAG: phosphatase PAP2 family protein [bacterium]|nr:phosphatase PAP2 family protein [bacterium]
MFSLDEKIFNFIHQLVGKSRLLDLLAIFFADYSGYILILIALVIIFSAKKYKDRIYNLAFISLILLLSNGIITQTIRFFFFRERPFAVLNFAPLIEKSSFEAALPSGHASFFFALAFAIFYLGEKRWSLVFLAISLLMGIARVYVGVHWPLDIVSGMLVAFVSAFIVKLLLEPRKQ